MTEEWKAYLGRDTAFYLSKPQGRDEVVGIQHEGDQHWRQEVEVRIYFS